MNSNTQWYGAVEAGGTTFVCAVGRGAHDIRALTRIPTTTPTETLGRVVDFFRCEDAEIAALGVGTFGPVDLAPDSATFGHLLQTPKQAWTNTDLVGPLQAALQVPVVLDTDVNVAARAELQWGAAASLDSFVYLTVGTGVGGSLVVNGSCQNGLLHPEMGHIHVPRAPGDDFDGVCPYHGDCLEGLASAPAIAARWGAAPHTLPDDHPAWPLQAHYLAQACITLIHIFSPERIILGGGIMQRDLLFPMIRARVQHRFGSYLKLPALTDDVDSYIVPPALGTRAGVLGALALAHDRGAPSSLSNTQR